MDNVHKGLDVFARAKADPKFAKRIKVLRIHWAYEEGDMLDVMIREYTTLMTIRFFSLSFASLSPPCTEIFLLGSVPGSTLGAATRKYVLCSRTYDYTTHSYLFNQLRVSVPRADLENTTQARFSPAQRTALQSSTKACLTRARPFPPSDPS